MQWSTISDLWALPGLSTDLLGSLGDAASFSCCNFLNTNLRHWKTQFPFQLLKMRKLLLVVSLASLKQNTVSPQHPQQVSSRVPQIPKLKDAQVPYIKWSNTVSPSHLQVPYPQIPDMRGWLSRKNHKWPKSREYHFQSGTRLLWSWRNNNQPLCFFTLSNCY